MANDNHNDTKQQQQQQQQKCIHQNASVLPVVPTTMMIKLVGIETFVYDVLQSKQFHYHQHHHCY